MWERGSGDMRREELRLNASVVLKSEQKGHKSSNIKKLKLKYKI